MSAQEILSIEEWASVVQKKIGTEDFTVTSVKLSPMCEGTAGFMSDQFMVVVSISQGDGTSSEDLKFFMKVVPTDLKLRNDFVNATGAYRKEIDFYEKIRPQIRFNCFVQSPRRVCIPESYFTRADALVLEDLIDKDFKMVSSRIALDYDHCAVVLRSLANFHAATIIYEDRMSSKLSKPYRLFDDFKESLNDILCNDFDIGGKKMSWIKSCFTSIRPLIPLLPNYKDKPHVCQTIVENLNAVQDQVPHLLKPSKEYRNVICHGDLWSNNILFRYDKDRKPEEVRFVDFQVVRYLPPVTDIMLFLHTATRKCFRQKYTDMLLDEYYDEFATILEQHGVERYIFPKTLFLESCKRLRKVGVLIALLYSLLIYLPPDFAASVLSSEADVERFTLVDRGPEAVQCFQTDTVFREMVTEVLQEFIEYFASTLLDTKLPN